MSLNKIGCKLFLLGYIHGQRKQRDQPTPTMTDVEIKEWFSENRNKCGTFSEIVEYLTGPESQIETLING